MRRIIFFLFVLAVIMTGCRTVRETSSYTEQHKMETLMDRVDSLIHQKTVVQQDSAWRETILRQFQSIREKSDTSHYVVTDTAGNVKSEKIIINNVREVTSETDRQEIQVLSHRIETMDSTMNLMRQKIEHSDSLLQASQQTTVKEVPAKLSWWQKTFMWIGFIAILVLMIFSAKYIRDKFGL